MLVFNHSYKQKRLKSLNFPVKIRPGIAPGFNPIKFKNRLC
jgi:hypothetical protein